MSIIRRNLLFLLLLSLSLLQVRTCRAAINPPLSLTDKTFDNVLEAFNYPSMLILLHASNDEVNNGRRTLFAEGNDRKALDEFRRLSDDQLLQDIMLVTVDGTNNRLLAARMGVPMNELPSLLFLYSGQIFRYQGNPTSAELMRSYALQGFHNQGIGKPMRDASYLLWLKTKYMDWLFSGGGGDSVDINVTVIVVSGFVVGILVCSLVAVAVTLCVSDEGVAIDDREKKKQ